ncbi:hypothetical protein [Nocardia sp. NPDC056000]|uniref:hypothetical protein n=1 Tax=Nocardia sp. NPDC056000 TaxID=3345674 RepID=UPI0035E20EF6
MITGKLYRTSGGAHVRMGFHAHWTGETNDLSTASTQLDVGLAQVPLEAQVERYELARMLDYLQGLALFAMYPMERTDNTMIDNESAAVKTLVRTASTPAVRGHDSSHRADASGIFLPFGPIQGGVSRVNAVFEHAWAMPFGLWVLRGGLDTFLAVQCALWSKPSRRRDALSVLGLLLSNGIAVQRNSGADKLRGATSPRRRCVECGGVTSARFELCTQCRRKSDEEE